MYGQPDIEVVFLVAIPGPSTSGLKIAQEPSVDIVLRPAFHLKTASWEYFDYCTCSDYREAAIGMAIDLAL